MSRSINIVLRILCIILVVVILLSTLYSYCVSTVNAFYDHDEEDPVFSSMEIIKIFSMNNGKTMVLGTFLQGDNLLSETCIFVKSYDSNGKILATSSLAIQKEYEISDLQSNGNSVLIKLSKNSGNIEYANIVQIDDNCNVVNNFNIQNDYYTAVFTGFINDEVFVGTVSDGYVVSIKDFSNEIITSSQFMEDITINDGFYAEGNFYLIGETGISSESKDLIVKLSLNNEVLQSWTIDENLYFSIEDVTSTIDGKVYLVGKYFNTEVYKSFIETKTSQILSDNAITPIANQAISTVRNYFPVLFSSDYQEKPWCSVFMSEIGEEELGEFVSPIADGENFGISEFVINNKTQQGSSVENQIATIGTISSKMTESKNSENYKIYCYKLYSNFETSNSVEATIDASTDCFMGYDAFGRFYVYIGKVDDNGKINYCLKFFSEFKDFQEEQNALNVYTKIVSYYEKYFSFRILGYVFVFLLLYTTCRFYGVENKQNERKKRLY